MIAFLYFRDMSEFKLEGGGGGGGELKFFGTKIQDPLKNKTAIFDAPSSLVGMFRSNPAIHTLIISSLSINCRHPLRLEHGVVHVTYQTPCLTYEVVQICLLVLYLRGTVTRFT